MRLSQKILFFTILILFSTVLLAQKNTPQSIDEQIVIPRFLKWDYGVENQYEPVLFSTLEMENNEKLHENRVNSIHVTFHKISDEVDSFDEEYSLVEGGYHKIKFSLSNIDSNWISKHVP